MCSKMDKKYDLSSFILIFFVLFFSKVKAMGALSPLDPSSFSRPELTLMKHVSLKLDVDFENKVLNGVAIIDFEVFEETAELVLDVSNLTIESIALDDGVQLEYKQDEPVQNFGSKLTITLPKSVSSGDKKDDRTISKEDNACDVMKFTGFAYAAVPSSSKCTGPNKSIKCYDGVSEAAVEEFNDVNVKFGDSETSSESDVKCKHCEASTESENTIASKFKCSQASIETKHHKLDISCICCCKEQRENECARLKIRIKYTTSPTASALQWLDPQQTSGKKHPYLFSQCQPIHARSILPCQDSPAVKFTYDAEVTAPEQFTVLMSALRGETRNNKTSFRQPVPLPAYLVAIAVGVLESKSLGPRSLVWSEKEEIERSAWEFAETENYLQAAEKLCGPYVWTQYDLLVLPPSFPYGGMENPCLTFVTPTLLAGDRSQADVIVHEIMHSWTGNLVTNNNFEHFWLNEGFTVFLERKVAASLIADAAEAKKSRDFHSLLGLQELTETVNDDLGASNPLTKLVVDLNGVHPDDAFSTVPYEKGSLFLVYLEKLLGGPEVFDDFLRAYLNNFQRKSLDTDQFKAYFLNYFKDNDKLAAVNWDSWLYSTGMPPIIPDYDTSMTKAISSLLEKIKLGNSTPIYDDVRTFTPHQMINLLQELVQGQALPLDKLRVLGAEYKINTSKNTEILYRWLRLCIRSKDLEKLNEVFSFVNGQGRMKYVRPIYRDLYAWEEVRQQAIDNFLKNESSMMHVSAYTLRKDLHLSE